MNGQELNFFVGADVPGRSGYRGEPRSINLKKMTNSNLNFDFIKNYNRDKPNDHYFSIKNVILPEEYFFVLNQANGFYTSSGLFRFFGTVPFEGIPDVVGLNHSDWVSAYDNPKLSQIIFFAEDIFGDLYGFLMQGKQNTKIIKFLKKVKLLSLIIRH